ncbi:MAG: hypothetical protein E6I75_02455 [Chloroflexi bacterium]|nr:MAG: hypothetical protein E6I75_02455 [Chloroflexota bacterium]
MAAAAWTPFSQLFAHLLERHRLVRVGEEDAKDGLERGHVAVDVVLRSTAVLTDAFERIAAVGGLLHLEAHATRRLVKNGRTLLDFLADLGTAGVAHTRADHVVERQTVLFEPRRISVVITSFFGGVAGATTIRQAPRGIDHSAYSFD